MSRGRRRLGRLTINDLPPRHEERLPDGLECLPLDGEGERDHFGLGSRQESPHKPPDDQVKDLLFGVGERRHRAIGPNRDDGSVVAHLRAVEHPLIRRIDAEVERLPGRFCRVRHRGGDVGELIPHVLDVVLGPKVLVLGPWVRNHLLLGVEALGDLQRHVAREAIPVAGIGE